MDYFSTQKRKSAKERKAICQKFVFSKTSKSHKNRLCGLRVFAFLR